MANDEIQIIDPEVKATDDNVEVTAAWDGPLFDIWLRYRELIESQLRPVGEAAFDLHPPPRGGRCLDIGCGLGDTTSGSPISSAPRDPHTALTWLRG